MKNSIKIFSSIILLLLIWFVSNQLGASMKTELDMNNIEPLIIKSEEKKLALEPVVICSNVEECEKSQTHTINRKDPSFPTLKSVKTGDELLVDFKNMDPDEKGLTTLKDGNMLSGYIKNNRIEVIDAGADLVRYEVYGKWENKQKDPYGIIVYLFEAKINES